MNTSLPVTGTNWRGGNSPHPTASPVKLDILAERRCRRRLKAKSMATEPSTRTLNEQDLRDLGFGAVVSRESQQRLLTGAVFFNAGAAALGFCWSFSPSPPLLTFRGGHFFW